MNEARAINLCLKHHDPIGFEYLFKKYRKEAFSHAIALLGNHEDAADACQESFSNAFSAMPKLRTLDEFYPWFYRILRNYCLNLLHKKKMLAKYKNKACNNPESALCQQTPPILIEEAEEQTTVWYALEKLNLLYREILIMKYIQGFSYDRIKMALNIPRGTVMSRLFYARKAFRDEYLKLTHQEGGEL